MINFLRRCVGWPPFKYKVGDVVKVRYIEHNYSNPSASIEKEILGMICERNSEKKNKLIKIEHLSGITFQHYRVSRINEYKIAYQGNRPSNVSNWKDEDELVLYDQVKTKMAGIF